MNRIQLWRAVVVFIFSCLCTVPVHAQPSEMQVLQSLHGSLTLTPTQEAAWQLFEQAYAPDPQEITKRRNALAGMSKLTAPQRVDLSVNLLKEDLKSLGNRGAALKTFYGTLSPKQQSIFDHETMPARPGGD
jgi:protein CpxP